MSATVNLTVDPAKTLQIYSTGINNNFNFIKEYALNNKLFTTTSSSFRMGSIRTLYPATLMSTESFETFRLFIKVVEEMFPGRWNIEFEATTDGKLIIEGVSILFPELEIKNSSGAKHLLRDLVLALPIYDHTGNKLRIGPPHGGRLTMTESEAKVSYQHSHLQRNSLVPYNITNTEQTHLRYFNTSILSPFCTGNGPIMSCISEINYTLKPTEDMFIELFIHLLKLGKWESLEGGPYAYMQDVHVEENSHERLLLTSRINTVVQASSTPPIPNSTLNLLFKLIKSEKPDFYPKFEVQTFEIGGTKAVIQNKNELFNTLVNIMVEKSKSFSENTSSHGMRISSNTASHILNIYNLMNLLVYKEQGTLHGINPLLLTIPQSTSEGPSIADNITYISAGPAYFFRGESFRTKVIKNPRNSRIQRLDLSLKEVDLKESVKEKLVKYLENQIEQKI